MSTKIVQAISNKMNQKTINRFLSLIIVCYLFVVNVLAHQITVQSSVCGMPITYEVDNGATVTLVATPEVGSHFVRWSDGDTSNPRSIVATGDANYTAVFEQSGGGTLPTKYTATICAGDCATPCVGEFNAGSSLSITAVPMTGYKFKRWSDGNTSNPRNLVINSDVSFCAEFESYSTANTLYSVNVQAEGCANVIKGNYLVGTQLVLIAQPNPSECDIFSHWDDASTSNTRTITVTGDATYTATFDKIQYTIEVLPDNPAQGSATVTNL